MNLRIAVPYLLAAIAYISYSVSTTSYIVSATALFFFGMFLAIGNIVTISFYQQATLKKYTAQIMVLVNLVSNASGPIAMAMAGALLLISSTQELMLFYGGLAAVVGFVLFFNRNLKRFCHV